MNNADMPAMPVTSDVDSYHGGMMLGLTKREYFSGLAMQSIVAADTQMNMTEDQISDCAVTQADSLLKRLEQDK